MKEMLMKIDVCDRYYYIYVDSETNVVNALSVKKDLETYYVTNQKELAFLNDIIKKNLSKKYFKEDEIEFEGEIYQRYLNRYDKKNFFAKYEDNNKLRIISYEENPELYDLYNPTKMVVYNAKFGHTRNTGRSTNSNRMKVIGATAVGAIIITITGCGNSKLANSEVPVVTGVQQETSLEEESEEVENFDEVEALKGYQTVPENENQEMLKQEYDAVKTNLEEIGLKNWEIAIELNSLKEFNSISIGEKDEISFYYDSESDRVVYIYGDYDRDINAQENTSKEEDSVDQEIPENVQTLINTINANPNLTEEEKQFIIDSSLQDLIENSEHLQTNILTIRYGSLDIDYDESNLMIGNPDSPYVEAGGYYSTKTLPSEDFFEEHGIGVWKDTESFIKIGETSSFEEANENTLRHEIGHVRGNFGQNNCLLNEGYNSWNTEDISYKNEQAMAMLMVSVFGKDVLDEGYYTFDLDSAIANKIAEKTGKDGNESYEEARDLLSSIQSVLYDVGEKSTELSDENAYRNDEDIMMEYKEVMEKIDNVYKEISGKSLTENNVAQVIKDYILGTNDSKVLVNNDEKISGIKLGKDGTLDVAIETEHGQIQYKSGPGHEITAGGSYYRNLSVKPRRKNQSGNKR